MSSLDASRRFWVDVLGFDIVFDRPEARFLYLAHGAAQVMLEEGGPDTADGWRTAPLERPFGPGVNSQIEVADVAALEATLAAAGHPLFRPVTVSWYRDGAVEHGHRELLVQDPDGYLLRFADSLGERPARSETSGGQACGGAGL